MENKRYTVLRKIGEGTFGRIYEAFDNQPGNAVALKFYSTQSGIIPNSAIREIQFHSRINHPNIIGLTDYFHSKTDVILAYEFMEIDLYNFIKRIRTPLAEPQLKCLFKSILTAISHIHSNGIMHRDIKTSNFLMSKNYTIKLGDMGLATVVAQRAGDLTLDIGTRWYKSPELLLGYKKYSYSSDVWSVGCVFAEIAGLTPIFKGSNDLEQLSMISQVCGDIVGSSFPV
jgi:serine/threonine protein kinase